MTVANKSAVASLQAGTILVLAQLLATCGIVLILRVLGLASIRGSWGAVMRWAPIGLLFGLLLFTGMQALKYASLSTLTVLRNGSPLFLLFAEWRCFRLQPTPGMVASLVVILAGVCLYTWGDVRAAGDLRGILYIFVDIMIVCVDRLLERYLLGIKPLDLSIGAIVLVQNLCGSVTVALLLIGPCAGEWNDLKVETPGVLWGLISLVGGAAMAYTSVFLARAVSATAALVVANVDKVVVLGYGVLCMGDRMDATRLIGCTLSLGGGAMHAVARLRVKDDANDEPQPMSFISMQGPVDIQDE